MKRSSRVLRAAPEAIVWSGISLAIWVMSLSAVPLQELLVGSGASVVSGSVAAAARRAMSGAWVVPWPALRALLMFPASLLSDTVQVLLAAVPGRRHRGGFERLHVEEGQGPESRAQGRRAVAVLLTSITPGTYAIDLEPDHPVMVVHRLATAGPRQEVAAAR